jgi:hypothetical protein
MDPNTWNVRLSGDVVDIANLSQVLRSPYRVVQIDSNHHLSLGGLEAAADARSAYDHAAAIVAQANGASRRRGTTLNLWSSSVV